MARLPYKYYRNEDVLFLGQDLLGKWLCTQHGKGLIIETESYKGPEDKASHAYMMRKTTRNVVMYEAGGVSYVYICYGMHHLFNIVTGSKGTPHAVLIRGILPENSVPIFGPGKLSTTLGITKQFNGVSLLSDKIWLEESRITISDSDVEKLPRVGIAYAAEHALLPWRFRIVKSKLEQIHQNLQSGASIVRTYT